MQEYVGARYRNEEADRIRTLLLTYIMVFWVFIMLVKVAITYI